MLMLPLGSFVATTTTRSPSFADLQILQIPFYPGRISRAGAPWLNHSFILRSIAVPNRSKALPLAWSVTVIFCVFLLHLRIDQIFHFSDQYYTALSWPWQEKLLTLPGSYDLLIKDSKIIKIQLSAFCEVCVITSIKTVSIIIYVIYYMIIYCMPLPSRILVLNDKLRKNLIRRE